MKTSPLSDRLPDRFPFSCQWEITCRCNLRCVMCYTDCFNRPDKILKELSTRDILRIMDELAEEGCVELCLTGGEPLIRADFFELYDHATSHGFFVTLFTNGTLITEAVADRLAATPPHRIEISLHGSTRHTFETVTQGRGSYDRCLAAIRLLLDRQLPLAVKTTAMTLNHREVLDIKQYVDGLGSVSYKLGEDLRPTLSGSDAPGQWALSDQELLELNLGDPDLSTEAYLKATRPDSPCRSGQRSFHIDAYGYLQLCSGNRRDGYDLRHGSFHEGFYEYLPKFSCPWKVVDQNGLVQLEQHHA